MIKHRQGKTCSITILTYFFHNIFLHNHFQANRYIHNPQPGHGKGLHFGILHPHNHQDLQQHIIIKYMKSASTLCFKQIRFWIVVSLQYHLHLFLVYGKRWWFDYNVYIKIYNNISRISYHHQVHEVYI